MSALIAALVAEIGIITWRDLHKQKILPPPSDYAAAALIFGAFGLVGEASPRVAAMLGWGVVLATFLELWDPTSPTNLSGAPAAAPSANVAQNAAIAAAPATGSAGATGAARAAQLAQQRPG
jgi:hypothetical protein